MGTEKISRITGGIRQSWSFIKDFATLKSAPIDTSTENTLEDNYDKKARFYAFLPALEEQRDWLEKVYKKYSSMD